LIRTFAFDNFVSIITDAREVIKEKQEAITDEFYDDYVRLVFGIGAEDDEERRSRSLVGGGIMPRNRPAVTMSACSQFIS